MNRTDFLIALIGISALVAGCEKGATAVTAPASKTSRDPGVRSAQIADAQKQYLSIEAVAVSQAVDVLALPGRVTFRPQAQSAIGATTAGRVVAVLVQAGQVVKAGTELLTIESADAGTARATLDQAATRLGSAESVFRRQVEMVEKGVGLEFERQEAEARLKEARAEYERARNAADLIGSGQGIRVTGREFQPSCGSGIASQPGVSGAFQAHRWFAGRHASPDCPARGRQGGRLGPGFGRVDQGRKTPRGLRGARGRQLRGPRRRDGPQPGRSGGDSAGAHGGRKGGGAWRLAARYPGRAAALIMLRLLIETCVHRRVAALFATLVVAAFGLRAYLDTPIEAYPAVTNTQVTVINQLPGNAPEEIERRVTVPLERELNGTPGMTLMRSESLFGLSLITLTFSDDTASFPARTVVLQRAAAADLPQGVTPEIAPEATPLGEVYQFRVTSDRHDLYQLRSEMQWNIVRVLRQVPGVADIVPFGGYLKEIHVEADPARLFALGLTLGDLEQAIAKSNLNVGGGFLRHGDQELTVRGIGFLESAEDIKRILLKSKDGTAVTLGDVSNVVQSFTPRRGTVGVGLEKEGIEGFVWMRRGQNPSLVLDGVHDKVRELNETILPKGMRIEIYYDRSDLVGLTLSTVHKNLLSGFMLVVAVMWLFLRSTVGSVTVAVVIPLSLLVAFLGLYALGLPANLISMGAIDFGILVDGAVVLVENVIHALRQDRPTDRRDVLRLVVRSAVDVGRPTLYAMLIIIAALVPAFTLQSVEGRIFRPLALTYSFALIGALVFALTLVPALCAALFRPRHAKLEEPPWVERLRARSPRSFSWPLEHRGRFLRGAFALPALAGVTLTRLGTEFLPELDEGDIQLFVEMPPSIALEKGQDILLEVRRRVP